jgi:signal peptidase I
MADPYEVIGVPRDASLEDVRSAYRENAQVVHPDLHATSGDGVRSQAERRMLELNTALQEIEAERAAEATIGSTNGPVAERAPRSASRPPAAIESRSSSGFLGSVSRLRKNPLVDLLITLVAAVAIAYGVQRWIVKPYRIPSPSMERTLHIGDRVLAVRFLYRFEDPHRGDIIVFHPNGIGDTALYGDHVATVTYIKRLIGMPGDWVQASNGHVQICTGPAGQGCKTLNEPYVSSTQVKFSPIHVPVGHYFMMGDNREFSDDSRDWGSIKKSQIIGRAFMIYWPPTRIRFY